MEKLEHTQPRDTTVQRKTGQEQTGPAATIQDFVIGGETDLDGLVTEHARLLDWLTSFGSGTEAVIRAPETPAHQIVQLLASAQRSAEAQGVTLRFDHAPN